MPHSTAYNSGKDKAQGLTILDEQRVKVVFDSRKDARTVGEHAVWADVLRIGE